MTDHCMNDIYEQCFSDCPNCPRAVRSYAETDWDKLAEEEYDDSL